MEAGEPVKGGYEADLTRAMEHLRPYVSVHPQKPSAYPVPGGDESVYGVPASVIQPPRRPAERSKSPSNAQKRRDPFQFGSRYLEEGDNVFEFNAWDHVDADDSYKEFAESQYQRQREAPVSEFDKGLYYASPEKWWNKFYTNNRTNFFKNRNWLFQEFATLSRSTSADSPVTILEVGAGAGNTAFPILAANRNPKLKIHACDYSSKAVELIRANEAYDTAHIQADVWDVAGTRQERLPPDLTDGSVDIVILVFTFSALSPAQWPQALENIWNVLKPGGDVLFRDYGRGDLAQVRFKKGRYLEDNFYVRGDGTRVYFFEKDELERLWSGSSNTKSAKAFHPDLGEVGETSYATPQGLDAIKTEEAQPKWQPKFEILNVAEDRRMLVNRQRKLKMYRCWMQAHFRKADDNKRHFQIPP